MQPESACSPITAATSRQGWKPKPAACRRTTMTRRSWDRNTLPAALTSASISASAMRGARAWRTAVRLRISFLNWNGSAFRRRSGRPSHRKISCGCWNKKESFYAEKLAGDRRFFRFLRTVAKMMERPTEKGLNYSYI